jgi:hypothetical protein
MTAFGDSHTGFDDSALLKGGLGGGALIAGAIVAGVSNHLARVRLQRANEWNQDAWERALEISEMLRKRDHERAQKSERENASLRVEISRLRNAPRVAQARAMLARR